MNRFERDLLLAIDVGNTNLTLGAFRGSELIQHWRLATRRHMTADELALNVEALFNLVDLGHPRERVAAASAASVVPTLDRAIREWGDRYLGGNLLLVDRGTDLGVTVHYVPPEAVGADRLINAIAAYEEYGGPGIVVDFGTATTFDAVSATGDYLGGAIFPGIGISADALFAAAAKLPRVELRKPGPPIGRTTVDSLTGGMVYGYASMVDGMVRRFRDELGPDAQAIATGGLADLIAAESDTLGIVDPWLTLKGLRLLWERRESVA